MENIAVRRWMPVVFLTLVTIIVIRVYIESVSPGLYRRLSFINRTEFQPKIEGNSAGDWTEFQPKIQGNSAAVTIPKHIVTVSATANAFDIINASFQVRYSEAAITQTVEAIHRDTQQYVKPHASSCQPRLPRCLIVGNYKCGTRELIDFMSMHPRIKIKSKPNYEVPFFDQLYSKGLEWLRKSMPCSYENQITVAKSPTYFQSPEAPSRIHAMNSSIKLIVLVRDPVSAVVSHFTFHQSILSKYHYKLEEAIINKTTGEIDRDNFFVKHAIYDEGMERYLQYFNFSQIKVIEYGDIKKDPYRVLRDLEEFLNLEHTIHRDNFIFDEEKGYFCLRQNRGSKLVACYGDDRGRNGTNVKQSVRDSPNIFGKLKTFFKPHNERFFQLLGHKFDWSY